MTRSDEIYELLQLSPEELVNRSGGRLTILKDLEALHQHFAAALAEQIKSNNEKGEPTVLILPYGPIPQYDIFVDLVNAQQISLENCTFFFMDEYCDQNGVVIPPSHPLSFRGGINQFFSRIDHSLAIPDGQVVFPTQENLHRLTQMIQEAGGVDTCYGGIGIHGHVAFNEPEANVRWTDPRLVYLNDFTVTINTIRAGVGGNLHNFPNKALTLGMNQVMDSRQIRLYCRNGTNGLDWANTILRLAVLGASGDDYPVTYVNDHPDWTIITDRETARSPEHILEFL
jgi:glucosamine-6-phosphate deaminase